MRIATTPALAAALCLVACKAEAPPPARVPASKPVAAALAAPAAPVAPPTSNSAFAGEALAKLLSCGDPDFLLRPSDEQAKLLQGESRLRCDAPSAAATVHCTAAAPVTAFGLRLHSFTLSHAQGGHALVAQLQGDLPALLQGVAQAYPQPVRSALGGRLISLADDDSRALRLREGDAAEQSSAECRVAAANELLFVTLNEPVVPGVPMLAMSATASDAPAAPTGSEAGRPNVPVLSEGRSAIAGRIEFPGGTAPALHICAFRNDNGGAACIRTARGQSRYRIERLPGGEYLLWAWLQAPEGGLQVMRAVHAVQCARAPCVSPPRMVRLPEDTAVDGIALNHAAESYPDQPAAPTRQP
jgi:hypothetical protein